MIEFLCALLFAVIVVGLIYWLVTQLPLSPPLKQIAQGLCIAILLFWVLKIAGMVGPAWRLPR